MPQESKGASAQPRPESFYVVVVDDDDGVREVICECVRVDGYRVTGVSSGQEALDLARRLPVNLILTDLMMPGMNGWQVLKAAKAQNPNIVVVVFTGYISEQGEDILLGRGADAYLVKPIDRRRLQTLLRALLFPNNLGREAEVVVIDDDPAILKAIEAALGKRGLYVLPFEDSDEAMRQIQEHLPDLVLIDLRLPGVDGLDLCSTLRHDPETNALPILIITAQPSREDVKRAIDLHINGFIVKPFSSEALVEKALQVLRQSGKR